jgi:hypothetical protein
MQDLKQYEQHKLNQSFSKEDFGKEVWIDTHLLDVDPDVQRDLQESQVKKIMRGFTPTAFGRLIVNKRPNGYYYVNDGQHRLESARRLNLSQVPCIVVGAETHRDEAINFIKINETSAQVKSGDKYRIGVSAGVEEWMRVKEVLDAVGLQGGTGANKVNALSTIYKQVNQSTLLSNIDTNIEVMIKTLRILSGAFGIDGVNHITIAGMVIFVRHYIQTEIITNHDAISRFKNVDIRALICKFNDMKENSSKGKVTSYFAYLLWTEYNRGLRDKNKLPLRIEI